MNLHKVKLGVVFGSLGIALLFTHSSSFFAYSQTMGETPSQRETSPAFSREQLCHIARPIVVKIFADDNWGSGVLVKKQGTLYSIVTNDHVLEASKDEYIIETHDGKSHQAKVLIRYVSSNKSDSNDLAILQFDSPIDYSISTLAEWSGGQRVIAAGYPNDPDPMLSDSQGFMCSEIGSISLSLTQPMDKGYQLGYYLNHIRKGMSGGPILNEQGHVVGIHGWGQPVFMIHPNLYTYRSDGRLVSESLPNLSSSEALNILSNSGWAIPIETLVNISSPTLNLTLKTKKESRVNAVINNPNQTINLPTISADSQRLSLSNQDVDTVPVAQGTNESLAPSSESVNSISELEKLAQQITVLVVNYSISEVGQNASFFSSGVILARDDKTYYVLTSEQVVHEQQLYQLITPDLKIYPVRIIGKYPELDLAILQFTSEQRYQTAQVAALNNSEEIVKNTSLSTYSWINLDGQIQPVFIDFRVIRSENSTMDIQPADRNEPINGLLGGGLLNQQGQLMGIYKGIKPDSEISEGIPIHLFWQIAPLRLKEILLTTPSERNCDLLFGTCSP